MNYFELYELPVSFRVEEGALKRKFYELSRKFHPDFHAGAASEEQERVLELSTLNNKAYQVLTSPLKRIEYVLTLNNLLSEGEKYQLPQSFLMEMMDVNEAIMEQEFVPDAAALEGVRTEVAAIEAKLFDELKSHTDAFDSDDQGDKEALLREIKDIWYRQKYLLRIRESLNRFASRL
ncbi:MAG TPA: Fe-S protein assembly co-chaperone HscB [Sphingobacteriaceae bacterium]